MKRALSRKNLWEKTPRWVKSTVGRAFGLVPPSWLLGRTFRASRAFVRDAQWWSVDRAREYQLAKVRTMLTLAYERSAFYRRTFDATGFHPGDLRSLDDFGRLPMIDKQTVLDNLSDMCTRSIKAKDVDFGSTGGTSGKPLHFYLDAGRSSIEYAYLTSSWERAGYKLGMPMAVLRGRVVRPDRRGLRHEYDPLLRHHYYSNFHMTDDDVRRYLAHIRTIGPCALHAYPSSAYALAHFILETGEPAPQNIRAVLLESENVYAGQIEALEKVFAARAFSSYGHSEKCVLAAQCEHTRNYHVWPTYGYFELLDEQGTPIRTVGQEGEIVGTGFINTIMPFIRYRTGDRAIYGGDRCEACGREQVVIRDICGHRSQEVLVTADGAEISWTALNMHDDTFLHVRQFQFLQETPGRAVLRIVPAHGFGAEDAGRIHRNLGRKFDHQLSLTVELVDTIPLSPRGKAIYVDQRIACDQRSGTTAPRKRCL